MFKIFKVSGESMLPVLKSGQYILAESASYLFFEPKIGDVAVVQSADGRKIIKRVTAKIEGNYFLTGDNYENSYDSRNFGLVNKELILAKVLL